MSTDCNYYEKLLDLKIFNCAICTKLLSTPIMIVENVGNVCYNCYCINKFKGISNKSLEEIFLQLPMPCKYQPFGCSARHLYEDLNEHESTCNFITTPCLLLEQESCQWRGVQSSLATHFDCAHTGHIVNISSDTNEFHLDVDLDEAFVSKILMLRGKKDYFFKILCNQEMGTLKYNLIEIRKTQSETKCIIKHYGSNAHCVCTEILAKDLDRITEYTQLTLSNLVSLIQAEKLINLRIHVENSASNNTVLLSDAMLQHFECPVCNLLMRPPIFQCKLGHSFCNVCKPKLRVCPTCRSGFTNTRNYCLEGLTGSISYSCAYSNLGCEKTFSAGDASRHEEFCEFKPMHCPIMRCTFTGSHNSIAEHIQSVHDNMLIRSDLYEDTVTVRFDDLMEIEIMKYYITFNGNVFCLHFKRNSDYNYWAVEVLLKADENSNFIYIIGIKDSRRPEKQLIRTDCCFVATNPDEIFKKCILFPNNILASYCYNGQYNYFCKISKQSSFAQVSELRN